MGSRLSKADRFAQEYTIDHNGAAAAVRAGYAPASAKVTASRLLTKANVRAAVEAAEQEVEAQLRLSKQKVLDELQTAIDMARLKGDPMGMIAGWREIAKLCGFYAPEVRKVELTAGQSRTRQEFEAMSDEALLLIATADCTAE
jgi:phage terminase small subunit